MRKLVCSSLISALILVCVGCKSELGTAKAYEAQGDWPKAQETLQKAIEKKPEDPRLHNELGFVYRKRGYYDLAVTEYNKAIKLDPYYIEAFYNRGTLFYTIGEIDKAKTDFEKVISVDKNFAQAFNNLGLIYQLFIKNFDEALASYKKAIEIEPMNPVYHENLSKLYKDMGKFDLAKEEEQRAQMLRARKGGGD